MDLHPRPFAFRTDRPRILFRCLVFSLETDHVYPVALVFDINLIPFFRRGRRSVVKTLHCNARRFISIFVENRSTRTELTNDEIAGHHPPF